MHMKSFLLNDKTCIDTASSNIQENMISYQVCYMSISMCILCHINFHSK